MRTRVALRALVLESGLGLIGLVLWSMGRMLPEPPLTSWSAASSWYESVEPALALASVVRVGSLVITGWLLVATAGQLLVGIGLPRRARRVADVIAPRSLQRFVHGLAGLSLSAGLAVVVPSAGIPAAGPSGVAVLRLVPDPPSGTATLRLLPGPAPAAVPAPITPEPAVAPAPPVPPVDTVIVAPGDSLWSIAAEVVADQGAEGPGVEPYWRRLIEANRARLVDPANPDLIYPGQALVLPPV